MKRNQIILLASGLFLGGFLLCGGTGLLINKMMHGSDTGAQAKATLPATSTPTAGRPTEPAKTTVPRTVPATVPKTAPVPTGVVGPKDGNIPPEAELRQIVIGTLLGIDAAKKKKDPTELLGRMAGIWQTDQGKKDLQQFYQGLNINLAAVKDAAPVFKPAPVLAGDGVLWLKGEVPAKGLRVDFQFGYVLEQGAWKLKDIGSVGFGQNNGNPME